MEIDRQLSSPKTKVTRAKREKYNRISLKTKLVFYQKVIHQQANLIDVPFHPLRSPKDSESSIRQPKPFFATTKASPKSQMPDWCVPYLPSSMEKSSLRNGVHTYLWTM